MAFNDPLCIFSIVTGVALLKAEARSSLFPAETLVKRPPELALVMINFRVNQLGEPKKQSRCMDMYINKNEYVSIYKNINYINTIYIYG